MLSDPRVAILLAAHNGMQWIADQLQSILAQKDVAIHIFISIDTSSDDTLAWCFSLSKQDSRITVLPSVKRFGAAARNFFHLIREVNFQSFDYIAFADQDDIWLPDKLIAAHERIILGHYAAYSGNVTAFWQDGLEVLIDKAQPQRKYDYLFEAAGPGCSYVLRKAEALQFKKYLIENWVAVNEVALHDWFIYAWYRANNLSWYIDATPKVLYRQHSQNQFGANKGFAASNKRIKMIKSGWYSSEVNKIFNLVSLSLSERQLEGLNSNILSRWFILRNARQVRRRLRDRLFFFVMVILGIY